ncbi:acetyltransferase (GNAT) family protein [Paenibacillus taihuensis]|uniref:Acetyltransferase (GNAT) family protein n=1 Tax=Paenibacillus taihuensis TaxID=1156355 RepID=A0A3D9SCN9_9BACL|nr:GNAT family N-acetyltransferase [Paenibacillus taihuensis]REE89088.1 acetyltransferase (GNAT) family protein [Paenibacillus taihuensis]
MDRSSIQLLAPSNEEDKEWLRNLWITEWGGELMISRGRQFYLQDVEAVVAWADGVRVGAATYQVRRDESELTSLNVMTSGQGIGSALLAAVEQLVKQAGENRFIIITTNDNMDALRFYQRLGYRISSIYIDAVTESRKSKPSIPLLGYYHIPIRDEIELEKML